MLYCRGSGIASQLYMRKSNINRPQPKKHANIDSTIKSNSHLPEKLRAKHSLGCDFFHYCLCPSNKQDENSPIPALAVSAGCRKLFIPKTTGKHFKTIL